MNKIKFALVAAAMAFMALAAGRGVAEAATVSPAPVAAMSQIAAANSGLVEKVDYWGSGYCYRHPYHWRCRGHRVHVYPHCRGWRFECGHRWGWHSGRYYRCLRYHGC
jgi:hypothetical protein